MTIEKKILSILLVLAMVITMVPMFGVEAWADPLPEWVDQTLSGSGTSESDPYIISTYEQLTSMAAVVNADGNLSNTYIKLSADFPSGGAITELTTPIRNTNYGFAGTFDGNGKTVNISISGSGIDYVGLFGMLCGGTIKNITVKGTVSGDANVGGIVGYIYSGTINNCYSNATVSGKEYVGGVVGCNAGIISNCYATGDVTGTISEEGVGGVVGYNNAGTISNCYSTCTVSGINNVGGVVGYNDDGTVNNCYATEAVSGSNNVGGVVGRNGSQNGASVINCYSVGDACGTNDNVGGVVGYNYIGTVSNCYAVGNVTGSNYVGGVIGFNDTSGNVTYCYSKVTTLCGDNSGSFSSCSAIDSNSKNVTYGGGTKTLLDALNTYVTETVSYGGIMLSSWVEGSDDWPTFVSPAAKINDAEYDTIQAAVNAAMSGATIKLLRDVDIQESIEIASTTTVSIDLNGHVIRQTGNDSVIKNNGHLTIIDSSPSAMHYYTVSSSGVWVWNDSNTSNAITIDKITSANIAPDTVIKVSGGAITGGKGSSQDGDPDYGGGIFNRGTLIMYAGNVVGNMSNKRGGGVYNYNGTKYHGTFEIFGGYILGNTTEKGGGVYNMGTLSMTGGSITCNSAKRGSGLYECGNLTIGGTSVIENNAGDNLYLTVTISAINELSPGASIYITKSGGTGVFTNPTSKDYIKYFHSDYGKYEVKCDIDNRLYVTEAAICVVGDKTYPSLDDALDAAANNSTTIKLLCDVMENMVIDEGQNITLDLNGFVMEPDLTNTTFASVITNYGTLKIIDSSPSAVHYFDYSTCAAWTLNKEAEAGISISSITSTTSVVVVTGGCITGGNGSSKNSGAQYGGGIYNNNGNLTIEAGNIIGNSAGKSGGGVYSYGNSELFLAGGNIIGNSSIYGGGVGLRNGSTFKMSGGNILYNVSLSDGDSENGGNGGGVYIYESSFEMTGGAIEYNYAKNRGAGIFTYSTSSAFVLNGGIIQYNAANDNGGGVYLSTSKFTMISGNIENNTARLGGGVYDYRSEMILGGEPGSSNNLIKIINNKGTSCSAVNKCNVFLTTNDTARTDDDDKDKDAFITVGAISAESIIGISMEVIIRKSDYDNLSEENLKFANNGTSYDAEYFVSDIDPYIVKFNKDHLELARSDQTISFAGITNDVYATTYGAENFTQAVSGAYTSVTYSSINTSVASINESTGEVTIVGAGTTTITAIATESATYTSASAFYVLTVNKRPITITAGDALKTYDGNAVTTAAFTSSGLIAGDEIVATVTGSQIKVGTCASIISEVKILRGVTDVTANYDITTVSGILTVTAKQESSGSSTIIVPSIKKEEEKTEETNVADKFVDVEEDAYYYDAVNWAVEKGITDGVDTTHFAPTGITTRAQMVTFLWRAAGCPVVDYAMPFTDVASDMYYTEAVRWAVSKGITNGTSDTTFSPNAQVSRAQTVSFLWRYEGSETQTSANPFIDILSDRYYYNAVLWAKNNKVTDGTSANKFSPDDPCTRGQIVTFLYRDTAE